MKKEENSRDFDWLQGEIQRRFESLSPHLRRIAEYALADPNRFALQTIARTANDISVQPSTLVRFAKAFGYSGFSEMQGAFRRRLTQTADAFRYQIREQQAILDREEGHELTGLLRSFSETSVVAIDQVRHDVEESKLRQAADMLREAQSIHVVGQRRAFPVAACLSLGLINLGRRCQLLDCGAGMLPQQIGSLEPNDLLVAIGLSDFSRTMREVVPEAHGRGIPVLAISNSPTNPIARNSRLSLVVRDSEVGDFEPLAPYIVLAQALTAALSWVRK